jgi:hypothetical protein
MEAGVISETVTVQADNTGIETEDANIRKTITTDEVLNLRRSDVIRMNSLVSRRAFSERVPARTMGRRPAFQTPPGRADRMLASSEPKIRFPSALTANDFR